MAVIKFYSDTTSLFDLLVLVCIQYKYDQLGFQILCFYIICIQYGKAGIFSIILFNT